MEPQEKIKQTVSNMETDINKLEKQNEKYHYVWLYPLGGLIIGVIAGVIFSEASTHLFIGSLFGVVAVVIILIVCPSAGFGIGLIIYVIKKYKEKSKQLANNKLPGPSLIYIIRLCLVAAILFFAVFFVIVYSSHKITYF